MRNMKGIPGTTKRQQSPIVSTQMSMAPAEVPSQSETDKALKTLYSDLVSYNEESVVSVSPADSKLITPLRVKTRRVSSVIIPSLKVSDTKAAKISETDRKLYASSGHPRRTPPPSVVRQSGKIAPPEPTTPKVVEKESTRTRPITPKAPGPESTRTRPTRRKVLRPKRPRSQPTTLKVAGPVTTRLHSTTTKVPGLEGTKTQPTTIKVPGPGSTRTQTTRPKATGPESTKTKLRTYKVPGPERTRTQPTTSKIQGPEKTREWDISNRAPENATAPRVLWSKRARARPVVDRTVEGALNTALIRQSCVVTGKNNLGLSQVTHSSHTFPHLAHTVHIIRYKRLQAQCSTPGHSDPLEIIQNHNGI